MCDDCHTHLRVKPETATAHRFRSPLRGESGSELSRWVMVWTRGRPRTPVCSQGGGGDSGPALALDRVNVCSKLVRAGNASRCSVEPLDWPIIILGTHPSLFPPSASPASSLPLTLRSCATLGYCGPNNLPHRRTGVATRTRMQSHTPRHPAARTPLSRTYGLQRTNARR